MLRQSENPEQRSLADLVSAISELRIALIAIEARISDPSALFPREYFEHIALRIGRMSPRSMEYMHEICLISKKMAAMLSSKTLRAEEKNELMEMIQHLEMVSARAMHILE